MVSWNFDHHLVSIWRISVWGQDWSYKKKTYVTYVVRYAIWYHLYNLKNVKNTHGGVLILCFSRFLICKNGTKSRNASHM